MDILTLSLTAALESFSINCSVRPHETQTHLTKLFSTFLSLSQAHTLYKSELKLLNYVPLLFHTLPCISSSSQADDCQVSFLSKTEFPRWWGRILFINTCVNAAERCISAKHASIFICKSQSIWGFCLWQEGNLQRIPFQAFLPTHINLVTTSLLIISLSSLPVVQTQSLSSSYERAYLYRNLDPLSMKTSHPYPFLYFSSTQSFFHFISFHLYFLSPYILSL